MWSQRDSSGSLNRDKRIDPDRWSRRLHTDCTDRMGLFPAGSDIPEWCCKDWGQQPDSSVVLNMHRFVLRMDCKDHRAWAVGNIPAGLGNFVVVLDNLAAVLDNQVALDSSGSERQDSLIAPSAGAARREVTPCSYTADSGAR